MPFHVETFLLLLIIKLSSKNLKSFDNIINLKKQKSQFSC